MVYLFKKLTDLAGAPTTNEAGNVIAGQAAGATQGTHESTFRNPSAVYNANVGADMGGLETGVNKNIAQTQESLNKSSSDYKSQLQGIDKGYSYKGMEDLQNIGDTGTFSRLSSLVNPAGAQSQLAGVKSNTANYQPDTAGLAQSSNMGGLTAQLQNQYGTSAGGSRLDALLYRGGGNAGKAINQGLKDVNQFKQGQQQMLGQESGLLSQLNQGVVNKSNQLKSEGAAYKGQLQAGAATQAQQAQSAYDTQRSQGLSQLQQTVANTNYKTQLENILNSVFGAPATPATSPTPGFTPSKDNLMEIQKTPGGGSIGSESFIPGQQGPRGFSNQQAQIGPAKFQRNFDKPGQVSFPGQKMPDAFTSPTQLTNPETPTSRRLDRNFVGNQYQMVGQQPEMVEAAKAALTAQLKSEGVSDELIPQILASATKGGDQNAHQGGTTLDMSPYAKQQILNKFLGQIDMKSIDPTKFQGEARTFNQDAYLDPRFNQLGQLLGTEQRAGVTNPSGQYSQDQQGLQKAISEYLNPQYANAQSAASALFNPTYQADKGADNPYLASIRDLLKNGAFAQTIGTVGLAGLAPNVNSWIPGAVDTITQPFENPQQLIQNLWG